MSLYQVKKNSIPKSLILGVDFRKESIRSFSDLGNQSDIKINLWDHVIDDGYVADIYIIYHHPVLIVGFSIWTFTTYNTKVYCRLPTT